MKLKIISTEEIIHKSHNYKYDRPSYLGVISAYYKCQNCGDEQPARDYYLQPDKCITYKHTYLYPPTFIWESRSICSMEQMERAISETANTMLKINFLLC